MPSRAFSPDGRWLATATERSLTVLDSSSGRPVMRLRVRWGDIVGLSFSPGQAQLTVVEARDSKEGEMPQVGLSRWTIPAGKRKDRTPFAFPETGEFRPNFPSWGGRTVAFMPNRGECIVVREIAGKQSLLSFSLDREYPGTKESIAVLSLSPDGRTVLCGVPRYSPTPKRVPGGTEPHALGDDIELWEARTGQRRTTVFVPGPDVCCAALSPNGRLLATGQKDGWLRVWEVTSGRELGRLKAHEAEVLCLAFSASSGRLFSGSADATVLVTDVSGLAAWPRGSATPTPRQLGAWWERLGSPNAGTAQAALTRLLGAPEEAVRDLEKRLRPTPALADAEVRRLIEQLGSDDFGRREGAEAQLLAQGSRAAPLLAQALKERPGIEAQRRIERLLAAARGEVLHPQHLRELRALEVLEKLATPRARRLLEKLARGGAGSVQTEEARACLERLRLTK
jgi:hypothetical protein